MRPRGSLILPPLAARYISLEIIVFVKLNQSLELPRKKQNAQLYLSDRRRLDFST